MPNTVLRFPKLMLFHVGVPLDIFLVGGIPTALKNMSQLG